MTDTRPPMEIARAALRAAQQQGVVREFTVRRGGRATVYPAEGREGYPGKYYTEHTLDTLALLRDLGFNPEA